MSRVTLKGKDGGEVAFGIDPPLGGWFAQVYGPEPKDPNEDWPPRIWEFPISNGRVLELVEEHAVLDSDYAKRCRDAVALDLDPGEVKRD